MKISDAYYMLTYVTNGLSYGDDWYPGDIRRLRWFRDHHPFSAMVVSLGLICHHVETRLRILTGARHGDYMFALHELGYWNVLLTPWSIIMDRMRLLTKEK